MNLEKTIKNVFAADSIKDLEIRVAAASVKVRKATDEQICVEVENLQDIDYTCEVQGQRLIVIYGIKGKKHFINFDWMEVQIILYLPEGKIFENIELEIGAGEVDMKGVPVSCRDMDAEIGAGKWRAAQLAVTGRLDIQIGAGKAKIKDACVGTLYLECGVGAFIYRGCITGDMKVDCDVGSCKFQLNNKESDFNYEVSCALGNIRINKNGVRCLGSKKIYSDKAAKGTAMLKCELGSIELDTYEREGK